VFCARSSSLAGGEWGVRRGEEGWGAGVCSVSLVFVAAFVLGRLGSSADVRSARVVSLGSVGGPPMSVTVAGSVE
jgi:hypothetical protein